MLYRLAFLLGPSVSRMYNLELRSTLEEHFDLGSLSFPISAPVHDDSGKFRHYCKDTKNGLPLSYVFRGISRKWYRICRG